MSFHILTYQVAELELHCAARDFAMALELEAEAPELQQPCNVYMALERLQCAAIEYTKGLGE